MVWSLLRPNIGLMWLRLHGKNWFQQVPCHLQLSLAGGASEHQQPMLEVRKSRPLRFPAHPGQGNTRNNKKGSFPGSPSIIWGRRSLIIIMRVEVTKHQVCEVREALWESYPVILGCFDFYAVQGSTGDIFGKAAMGSGLVRRKRSRNCSECGVPEL